MNKKYVLISCLILLLWFFLDMIGVNLGDKYLVTQSFSDDGIFFLIYLVALLLFIFKERIGKYILNIWLLMWFITQFISHWLYIIPGQGLGTNKIEYFKASIKLFESTERYFPDIYHIVLHLLIIIALVTLNIYLIKKKEQIKSKTIN